MDQPMSDIEIMRKKIEDFTDLVNERKISERDVRDILQYIFKSKENFFRYIIVIDSAERKSDLFQTFTKLHEAFKKNSEQYYALYDKVCHQDASREEFLEFDKKQTRPHLNRKDHNYNAILDFVDFLSLCDIKNYKVNENEDSQS